jgi:hypothetical protein
MRKLSRKNLVKTFEKYTNDDFSLDFYKKGNFQLKKLNYRIFWLIFVKTFISAKIFAKICVWISIFSQCKLFSQKRKPLDDFREKRTRLSDCCQHFRESKFRESPLHLMDFRKILYFRFDHSRRRLRNNIPFLRGLSNLDSFCKSQ